MSNLQFWIDVEDSSGNKLGSGPIKSARNWRQTARLDRAGAFSFEMAVNDPQRALVTVKRIVRCWGILDGVLTTFGAGVVDKVTVSVGASGEPVLRVEGDDLARELTYRSVGFLEMGNHDIKTDYVSGADYVQVWRYDDGNYWPLWSYATAETAAGGTAVTVHNVSGWSGLTLLGIELDNGSVHITTLTGVVGSDLQFTDAVPAGRKVLVGARLCHGVAAPVPTLAGMLELHDGDCWLIGHDATFDTVAVEVYMPNLKHTVGDFYYYSSAGGGSWAPLTVEDWTINNAHSGIVTFAKPADWIVSTVNGVDKYWVKLAYTYGITGCRIASVQVDTFSASTDVPADIVTFAPTGWALGGNLTTLRALAGAFAGETCLEALLRVAELTGEHFYVNSARQVIWVNTAGTASGIRAIQMPDAVAGLAEPSLCYIESLEHVADASEVYTRVYPYGAGDDDTILTLANTTRTGDAAHTLSTANNYIEHVAGVAAYGQIDKYLQAPDLTPPAYEYVGLNLRSIPKPAQTAAADLLYDYAVTELDRHAALHNAYSLRVVGLKSMLTLGNKIRVVYRHHVGGVRVVDIDDDLYVLETTTEIADSGLRTTDLVVSKEGWWPLSEADRVINQRRIERSYRFHPQPRSTSPTYSRIALPDDGVGGGPQPSEQLVIADPFGRMRFVPITDLIPATRSGDAGANWRMADGEPLAFGPGQRDAGSEHAQIQLVNAATDYLELHVWRNDPVDPRNLPNGWWRLKLYSSGTTAAEIAGTATGSVGGTRLSLSNLGALSLYSALYPGTGSALGTVANVAADAAGNLKLTGAAHKTVFVTKASIPDNSPTAVFTITTTDEAGSNDGGAYVCRVRGAVGLGTPTISYPAMRYFAAHFSRSVISTGAAAYESAVTEEYDDALSLRAAGNYSVDGVTLTLTATSPYVLTVNLTVDVSGVSYNVSTALMEVELLWQGFTTAPVIAVA